MITALTIHLSYPLAFIAGLVSFLSPCVLPLAPAYVAFLAGHIHTTQPASTTSAPRKSTLRNGTAFVAGFSIVFILVYYIFTTLDFTLLREQQRLVSVMAGLIVIILALQTLGILRIGTLLHERRWHPSHSAGTMTGAFFLGLAFAAGWTPCIGPQLAAVIAIAGQHSFAGLPVMIVYCAGLAVPFLVIAALAGRLDDTIRLLNRRMGIITTASGLLLLMFGVLLVTDEVTLLNTYSFQSPFDL